MGTVEEWCFIYDMATSGGVYNGNMDSFGDVGDYSSLHVNSIVWLNAPSAANDSRPAGVFLHGTEGKCEESKEGWKEVEKIATEDFYVQDRNGGYVVNTSEKNNQGSYELLGSWASIYVYRGDGDHRYDRYRVTFKTATNDDRSKIHYRLVSAGNKYKTWEKPETVSYDDKNGARGNGRHLHRLNETSNDLLALPQYAGSVRCVRDKDAIKSVDNVINKKDITLSPSNSYRQEITITAVESWRVTNPGKKWVIVSPDNGGIGETKLVISSRNNSVKETATITIKFARGSEQTINVTQQ